MESRKQDEKDLEKIETIDSKSDNNDGKTSKNAKDQETAQAKKAPTMDEVKMELFGLKNQMLPRNAPKNDDELANKQEWKFWNTQPVKKIGDSVQHGINEPIEPNKKIEEIKKDPYTLPEGFHWDDIDLQNEDQLKELYVLLNENYVEDDDNMFRFDYSPSFLKWALQPPGFLKQWHAGVRVTKNKKLVGFISAVPAHMKVYDKDAQMVEINFLCVHKKLRSKRLAPVLIKEITRRVNLTGIFQAVYTAGVILPSLVAKCRYWHRSLNPKKLIEVGFSHLNRNMTMQRTLKLYRLPDAPKTPGFRKLKVEDCPQAFKLLNEYLSTKDLCPIYTEEEFIHWFMPRLDVIDSFVVEQNGVVTDFCSFYHLPSSIMQHPQHKTLKAAYSFYNVATKTPLIELINDCLISAKNEGQDVFNALDLMDNSTFLQELKFGIGDGNLQYYIYNWKCPEIPTNKVGLVLQ